MYAMPRSLITLRIIRITAVIPCFALLAFGGIYVSVNAVYLAPWVNVCESIALVNFLLLLYAYLAPRPDDRGPSFEAVYVPPKGEGTRVNPEQARVSMLTPAPLIDI